MSSVFWLNPGKEIQTEKKKKKIQQKFKAFGVKKKKNSEEVNSCN